MIEYNFGFGKKTFELSKDKALPSTNNALYVTISGEELKLVKAQFPQVKTNNNNTVLFLDGELMRFVLHNLELPKK